MNLGLVAGAALLAVAVAVRSTWSPCGLSMLSTVTPLAEHGRGHRFAATAAWFVFGAIAGGATLGAGTAVLAFGAAAIELSSEVTVALAALAATVAFAADLRLFGFRLPMHTRQVDEVWLGKYRPWVYGVGFGWQIGVGLATYIMTAGVYLLIVLAALSASPTAAFLLALGFGTVRGLAVLLGARITGPNELFAFHRRFERVGPYARAFVIVVEGGLAFVGIAAGTNLAIAVVLTGAVLAATLATARARSRAATTLVPTT
jgi:hypothetical protein